MGDVKQQGNNQSSDIADNTRHILALSGGKDSSALAVYMLGKVPNMEYVFCDTGEELDETYEYINRLQVLSLFKNKLAEIRKRFQVLRRPLQRSFAGCPNSLVYQNA